MAMMDAVYKEDDQVYVLGTVIDVNKYEEDVRYEMTTGIGKLYISQVKDDHTQNPYQIIDKLRHGWEMDARESLMDMIVDICNMDETNLEIMFGKKYEDPCEPLGSGEFKAHDIMELYDRWYRMTHICRYDIVLYNGKDASENDLECVVINIVEDPDSTTTQDITGESEDVYIIYDRVHRVFYNAKVTEVIRTGEVADIDMILKELDEAIKNADNPELIEELDLPIS